MKMLLGKLKSLIIEALDSERSKAEVFSIYSDVYKEKHGIRPRHIDWQSLSLIELQNMLNDLYDAPETIDWDDFEKRSIEKTKTVHRQVDDDADPFDDYERMPMRSPIRQPAHKRRH
jgi:hypothetical protein